MALASNIDAVKALQDEVTQTATDNNAAVLALYETMKAEVLDANTNGLGPISAGFLPDATGRYQLKYNDRAIEVFWNFEDGAVEEIKVLRPGDFVETVVDLS